MGIWTFVVGVMNQQEHGPLRQFIDGLPKERWVLASHGNNYGKITGITWWVVHEWLSLIQFLWQFPWEVFHLKIRLPPLGNHVKLNFDGSFNLCTQYVDNRRKHERLSWNTHGNLHWEICCRSFIGWQVTGSIERHRKYGYGQHYVIIDGECIILISWHASPSGTSDSMKGILTSSRQSI